MVYPLAPGNLFWVGLKKSGRVELGGENEPGNVVWTDSGAGTLGLRAAIGSIMDRVASTGSLMGLLNRPTGDLPKSQNLSMSRGD